MAKPFKIVLWIVGILIALTVTAVAAVALLFDPNDYKDAVVKAVKEDTGRDLTLGDIGLSVYPVLGASVKNVSLSNAPGFGPEPFLQVGEVGVGVKLMPLLFDRQVQVGTVSVHGLALNLAKDASGKDNWSDLSKGDKSTETETETKSGKGGGELAVTVDKVDIKDASFAYTDKQSGAAYRIDKLAIETGKVDLGQPLDVTISFLVNSAQPPLESEIKLAFTAIADADAKLYTLKDVALDTVTRGAAVPGGEQKASLRAQARYDGAAGAFELTDTTLKAAGLELTAAVKGEQLSGEAPKLSGSIATNTFNPRELAKSFGSPLPPASDPSALTALSFKADIAGDPKNVRLDPIHIVMDQTKANGWLSVKNFSAPVIGFALRADKLNADRYLASAGADKKDADKKKDEKSGDFKNTEIPVQALDAVNAQGTLALDQLVFKGLQMTGIKLTLDAPKGAVKTQELTASLYGGKIAQSAKITPGPKPKYDVKVGLNGVNSAPLQTDLMGKDWLSGIANFNLNFTGAGLTVGDVLRGMGGSLATSFQNGALEGFNLKQTIASAKATFAGQAAPAEGPKRTPFRDLKAAGTITNGVLDTNTFDAKGDGFALGGDGTLNLYEQTLDYTLSPTMTGEQFKDLAGTKIPVRITGSWFAPQIKVDVASVAKGRVKEELKQQEDKVREKAQQKFGDFLNKKFGPKPAPEPAPAPAEPAPASPEPAKTEPAPAQ